MFYNLRKITTFALVAGLFATNLQAQELDLFSIPGEEIANAEVPMPQDAVAAVAEVNENAKQKVVDVVDAIAEETVLNPSAEVVTEVVAPVAEAVAETEKPAILLNNNVENSSEVKNAFEDNYQPAESSYVPTQGLTIFANEVEDELFSQMSELEKESTLLTLQLKKEKIQNDIDSVKKQREMADLQEKERAQEFENKRKAAIAEEKRKLLIEEQKLKEKEIEFETLRQEKLLGSYKEKALEERQTWIKENADLYKKIKENNESKIKVLNEAKTKMNELYKSLEKTEKEATEVKEKNDAKIKELTTKISVLEAQLAVFNPSNPFGGSAGFQSEDGAVQSLDNVYAIVEIRGKGNKLIAKLLTKDGSAVLAQLGTELQTGHIVDEITETYLRGNIGGNKEYLYFNSGVFSAKKAKAKKVETPVKKADSSAVGKTFAVYNP